VNSGNPVRDGNLKSGFFALLSETGKVQGVFKSIQQKTPDSGDLVLALTTTRKGKAETFEIPLTFQVVGKEGERIFQAQGTLDLLKIGASSAVESISAICRELHKGKDGVSKTWSEVGFQISVPVNSSSD